MLINIFKKTKDKIRRGDEIVWVPVQDLECQCPRLKLHQTYLLIGNDVISASRVGVIIDRSSVVVKWTDDLNTQLRYSARRC